MHCSQPEHLIVCNALTLLLNQEQTVLASKSYLRCGGQATVISGDAPTEFILLFGLFLHVSHHWEGFGGLCRRLKCLNTDFSQTM